MHWTHSVFQCELGRLLDVVLGATSTIAESSCLYVMSTAECGLCSMYMLPSGMEYTVRVM